MSLISQLDRLHYLDHFLLFSSTDYHTIKQQISHYLCPHQFEVDSSQILNTRLNGFSFGTSALYDLKYSAPVAITIDESSAHYLFRVTLEGECKIEHDARLIIQSPGIMTVSHPHSKNRIITSQHCRNIILKLSRQEVDTQLYKMLGHMVAEPLLFDCGISCTTEGVEAIIETLNYLCHAHYNIQHWDTISESFGRYLIELILLKVPNNYTAQLQQRGKVILPGYMNKARQYIARHIRNNIVLAELGKQCGVSVRTLQKGFNQYFHQTPIDYIRDLRIKLIHHELQHSQAHETVTDILLRNGINSLGHFSTLYKKRYGCLPSQTLRQAHAHCSSYFVN